MPALSNYYYIKDVRGTIYIYLSKWHNNGNNTKDENQN